MALLSPDLLACFLSSVLILGYVFSPTCSLWLYPPDFSPAFCEAFLFFVFRLPSSALQKVYEPLGKDSLLGSRGLHGDESCANIPDTLRFSKRGSHVILWALPQVEQTWCEPLHRPLWPENVSQWDKEMLETYQHLNMGLSCASSREHEWPYIRTIKSTDFGIKNDQNITSDPTNF